MSAADSAVLLKFAPGIIRNTANHVRKILAPDSTGHDWWHVERVWQTARHIGEREGADLLVVELAALLHDIADWKFHDGDEEIGPKLAGEWLISEGLPPARVSLVCDIIRNISFKGAGVPDRRWSAAASVVQDADRLDAMGAIGIARTFAYGGSVGRPIHDPAVDPVRHATPEEYFRRTTTTINHFHEKLLLLKERMQTRTGRELAARRHDYMLSFLATFDEEWALLR
jgi:uncharacterized protein